MDTSCFVEDIYPQQMLYALTIRSPVARGTLRSIECPRLPNSYTLVKAADIPGKNQLEGTLLPILASGLLSYIGEPVALLLGPDKNMLEEYAGQCQVLAEEDTPVFSFNAGTDVFARREIRMGNPEEAFSRAAVIVRGDYRTGIQEHWYAEPVGAVAWLEQPNGENRREEGKSGNAGRLMMVRTATQWPFHVRRSVAQVLGKSSTAIQVQPTAIGLHMDGKLWYPSLVACHAALGAWITKKPVRLMLTRGDDFCFSPKRNAAEISIASALNEKGELIGADITVAVNLGAYGVHAGEILDQTCLGSLGTYTFENLKLSGTAFKTNIPPQGPFCGFGLAQGFFAIERHVSHIADSQKRNPAEWRTANFQKAGLLPLGIGIKDAASRETLLDTAAKMSDYYRKWASYELLRQGRRQRLAQSTGQEPARESWPGKGEALRGIGIAFGYQGSGLLYPGSDRGSYSIELTLEKDGALEIKTSMVSSDDDYSRVWACIAAEILSIDPAMVRIASSAAALDCGPACASRNAVVLTKLMEQSCLAIRKQRFRDPLPITVRKTIKPQRNPVWEERFPPPEGQTLDSAGFIRPGAASAVVEVEIDPIEYAPQIRGVWIAVDSGKLFSEDRARRSLKVSAIQALGWASRERISYANGLIPQHQFETYDIPSPADIPPIHIDFMWDSSGEPKGIGDIPFVCVPAAYLQAVSQAMDHHFQSIPIATMDIWEAGKLKKEETSAP